jgi:hypothetical protein
MKTLARHQLHAKVVGEPTDDDEIRIERRSAVLFEGIPSDASEDLERDDLADAGAS